MLIRRYVTIGLRCGHSKSIFANDTDYNNHKSLHNFRTKQQSRGIFIETLQHLTDDHKKNKLLEEEEYYKIIEKSIQISPTIETIKDQVQKLEKQKVKPTKEFLIKIIKYLSNKDKIEEANYLLSSINRLNIKLTTEYFNPLLFVHAKKSRFNQLDNVINNQLPKYDLNIDGNSMLYLISGYAHANNEKKVFALIHQFREKYSNSNDWDEKTFNIICFAYLKCNKIENVLQEIQKMKQKHIITTEIEFKVIEKYLKNNLIGKACNLFENIKKSKHFDVNWIIFIHYEFIKYYANIGDDDRIIQHISELKKYKNDFNRMKVATNLVVGIINNPSRVDTGKENEYILFLINNDIGPYEIDIIICAFIKNKKLDSLIAFINNCVNNQKIPLRSSFVRAIKFIKKSNFPPDKVRSSLIVIQDHMKVNQLDPYNNIE